MPWSAQKFGAANKQTLRKKMSIIRGDRRSFNIYIYIYILILIISAVGWNCQKYHVARWLFVGPLVPFGVFPSEFPTLSRN